MCEDKVLISIGESNGSMINGTVREVHIESLEEHTCSTSGGGDDDMMIAHFEMHDGAIFPGKTGKRVMRVST